MSDTAPGADAPKAATPAGIKGEASIARVLAVLATCAASLIVVSAAVPGSGIRQPLFFIAPIGGFTLAVLLWWQGLRLPRWCVEVVLAIGIGLVGIGVHFGGPVAEPLALFYVWISLYAFCYLPLPNAALQTVFIAISCGIVSMPLNAGLSFWLLVTGSSVTAGYWVHRLVAQIRGLALVEVAGAHAEAASRAKTEFLSRMSHELRTPLTAILGYAELLDHEQLRTGDAQAVASISRAGSHLLGLINESLDIARIEEGASAISLEPVPIARLVAEALELVEPDAAARDVTIDGAQPADRDIHVLADPRRLRQVLVNLLTNAVKYNIPGGRISVVIEPEGPNARIDVVDTGPGMSPDEMTRLFAPFERLGAARRGIEGTGLGLALSKALIEAMHGTISASSRLGEGSTFSIRIPTTRAPVRAVVTAPADASDTTDLTPIRVLYIEDTPSNVALVRRILEREPNVSLLTAANGHDGLDAATRQRPDLVLLDLDLPDMPGADVYKRLRAVPGTSAIPVVVVSADATPHQRDTLMLAGVDGYITKPFRMRDFAKVVRDHRPADGAGREGEIRTPDLTVPNRAL